MQRQSLLNTALIGIVLANANTALASAMLDGTTVITDSAADCCIDWSAPICQVNREIEVLAGAHLDFGSRTIRVLAGAGINAPNEGTVTIEGGAIEVLSGGYLSATCDDDRCGDLSIISDGPITVYGGMELVSNLLGGELDMVADGTVSITGTIQANGGGGHSQGGRVSIESGDNLQVHDIDVSGSSGLIRSGGEVVLESDLGLDVLGDINASGGAGGSISIWAYGVINLGGINLTTQASRANAWAGPIDIRSQSDISTSSDTEIKAKGTSNKHNTGGTVFLRAAGSVNLSGPIDVSATGGSGDTESAGGSVRIDAGTHLTVGNTIEAKSSTNPTYGGRIMLSAGETITINAAMDVDAGQEGGVVDILALSHIGLSANVDVTGRDGSGGRITAVSRLGTLDVRYDLDADGDAGTGGTIDLDACDITTHTATRMSTLGFGGTNRLAGAEAISVMGTLIAGAANTFEWSGAAPDIHADAAITPTASVVRVPTLGRCVDPLEPDDLPRPTCDVDGDGFLDRRLGGTDCDDQDPDVHPGSEGDPCLCGPTPMLRWSEASPTVCSVDPYPLAFTVPEACTLPADTGSPPDTGHTADTGSSTDTGGPGDTGTSDTGDSTDGDTGTSPSDLDGGDPDSSDTGTAVSGKGVPGGKRCGCAANPMQASAPWLLLIGLVMRRRQ